MQDAINNTAKCSVCRQDLPFSEFHKDRSKPLGICSTCKECSKKRANKWFNDNREHGKAVRREWYAANRQKRSEYHRLRRVEDPEREREWCRKWRAANREYKLEKDRQWQIANPEKVKRYRIVSEAKRRAAEGSFTAYAIEEIALIQKHKCAFCNKSVRTSRHIDHIIPLAKGGTSYRSNLQILCPPCNLRKSSKDQIEVMRSLGRLL